MTIPCQQEKTLERIEGKIDTINEKAHSIDLRVTKIETTQDIQKDYVDMRSKRNGQIYGTLSGLLVGLTIAFFKFFLESNV